MDGSVDLTLLAAAPAQVALIVVLVGFLKDFLRAAGADEAVVSGGAPLLSVLAGLVVGAFVALALRQDVGVGVGVGFVNGLVATNLYRVVKGRLVAKG